MTKTVRYWFINLLSTIATAPQPASFLLTISHSSQSNHTLSFISHFSCQSMTILSCSHYSNTLNPASNCPLVFYWPMRILLNTISATKAIPLHSPCSLWLWKPVQLILWRWCGTYVNRRTDPNSNRNILFLTIRSLTNLCISEPSFLHL